MSENVRTGLLMAYRKLMRPLVRILIRHGVTYHDLAALLKGIFVESAQEDFTHSARSVTSAKISILSGLAREEVEEQQKLLASGDLLPSSNLNQITRLLVGWHTNPNYTGPYGLPIELELQSAKGPDFYSLVEEYCSSIEPAAMLEELVQVGVVERVRNDRIKVLVRAYIPDSLHPDALDRMGEVISNFVTTLEHNMEKTKLGEGRFERVVIADDGLPVKLMPQFDEILREKGQQLLVELDNWISMQDIDPSTGRTNIRTGVGIYHYVESDDT